MKWFWLLLIPLSAHAQIGVFSPGTFVPQSASSPAIVHSTGGCSSSSSATYALTIPSTTASDFLAVGTYNEYVGSKPANTGLTWLAGVVTVTSTLNPGIGSTVAITSAAPSGWNVVAVVTASSSTIYTFSLASNPGTETSLGFSVVAPTVAASGLTFTAQEIDGLYDSTRRYISEWAAASITSGVTTVTATWPGSGTGCIFAVEYSNVTTLDASAVASHLVTGYSGVVSPFTGTSITPTSGKAEALWGVVFDSTGPNYTADFTGSGGWTVPVTAYENGGDFGSFAFYSRIVASTSGGYAITGSNSGTTGVQQITTPATFYK